MEAPRRDTLSRLALAEAVLTLWRWVADSGSLDHGLLPISWSSDNGNHLFVDSPDEGSGRSSSIGTYLPQVAATSAGV
jgi:hypothetical protein